MHIGEKPYQVTISRIRKKVLQEPEQINTNTAGKKKKIK
jgi:hypothetical protein